MYEDVFRRRFKFMAINDVMSLFYMPIIWFGLTQFRNISGYTDNLSITTPVFAIIFLVAAIVMPIVWVVLWKKW
jgi:hypothetical protein